MADFKISTFREALKSGSRPNLFRIEVTPPVGLPNTDGQVGGYTRLVRSAALPSATIGTIELPMNGGRRFKIGGDRVFTEWTSTVLNDESYLLRSSLESWQNKMVFTSHDVSLVGLGNRSAAVSGSGLYGTVTIYQLDENGLSVPNATYRLINCWPSDISAIDLSYDTTDAIEDFTVTWTYDYYENNFTSTLAGGSGEVEIPPVKADAVS
jgi:hypothetical protein